MEWLKSVTQQEGNNSTDEVEAANTAHKKEKGEAQQATLDRDKALDIWKTGSVILLPFPG